MKRPAKNIKPLLICSCVSGICALALAVTVMQTKNAASEPKKAAAVPSPPTGDDLAKCLSFSKPVSFKVEKLKQSALSESVEVIWAYSYSAEKQTLSSYTVGLYKARSLLGKKRNELEKLLEKQERERKPYSGKLSNLSGVETRANGRKVYFATLGFGPGGAFQIVFTTMGAYDVTLTQMVNFEDDMPEEKRLKNPASPRKELPEAFKQLEQFIPNLTEK